MTQMDTDKKGSNLRTSASSVDKRLRLVKAKPPYAEMRTASAFSFLDGASLPEDLIFNAAQKAAVDDIEVGRQVAPRIRVAFEVDDGRATTARLMEAGASEVAAPTATSSLRS